MLEPLLGADVIAVSHRGVHPIENYLRMHPRATDAELNSTLGSARVDLTPSGVVAFGWGVTGGSTTSVTLFGSADEADAAAVAYETIWTTGLVPDSEATWAETYGTAEFRVDTRSVIAAFDQDLSELMGNGSPTAWSSD